MTGRWCEYATLVRCTEAASGRLGKVSGVAACRPQLEKLRRVVSKGSVVLVTQPERLLELCRPPTSRSE